MKVANEEVPMAVRRRVAQLLENVRGTPMDPTKGRARLTGEVRAIFRPDVDDIAYYEFEVDLGRQAGTRITTAARAAGARTLSVGALGAQPTGVAATPLIDGLRRPTTGALAQLPAKHGFVIAAAGSHDFPICHFSLDREPPSKQLEMAAEEQGTKVERIYKLDALSYVGESPDGQLAAQTGQMPLPIKGLPEDPAKARGQISSTLSQAKGAQDNDEQIEGRGVDTKRRGSRPTRVELTPVDSWKELNELYRASFGPLLADLADQAAPAWEIDDLVEKLGEGVLTGTTHRVALLDPDATIEISGEGANLVEVRVDEGDAGVPAVELVVADARLAEEVSFDLHIVYGDGQREDLLFFAVSESTPSNEKADGGLSLFEEN